MKANLNHDVVSTGVCMQQARITETVQCKFVEQKVSKEGKVDGDFGTCDSSMLLPDVDYSISLCRLQSL
jgi:hypothetical protein